MKKIITSIVFIVLYGVCMAKPKIITSEPCDYRDVSCEFLGYQKRFKDEISYAQALEDLNMLIYIMKTAYSGFEDAIKRGLEINQIIEAFNHINGEESTIKVVKFNQFIFEFLEPYLQDFHFCIESKNLAKNFVTEYRMLYSDVYVKKSDEHCIIEKSDNLKFYTGEEIICDEKNLFLYPSQGEKIYKIGTFATLDESEKDISVICSGITKQVLCNVSNDYLYSNNIEVYKEIETADSLYIYIPTLMDLQTDDSRRAVLDENFKKLHSISERYSNKKNVILDYRTNTGGNSVHTSKFLANLYFLEKNCSEKKTYKNLKKTKKFINGQINRTDLISPAIIQAEDWLSKNIFSQEKLWINEFDKRRRLLNNRMLRISYINREKKTKQVSPVFKGKLIILSGKNTCSSSEDAIFEAKAIFSKTNQFIQVGENSAGCTAYGNVYCYQLINSGIAVHVPSFKSDNSIECPEGVGLIPDYWSTNKDILKTLEFITNDKELSEKLKDINNNL